MAGTLTCGLYTAVGLACEQGIENSKDFRLLNYLRGRKALRSRSNNAMVAGMLEAIRIRTRMQVVISSPDRNLTVYE